MLTLIELKEFMKWNLKEIFQRFHCKSSNVTLFLDQVCFFCKNVLLKQ